MGRRVLALLLAGCSTALPPETTPDSGDTKPEDAAISIDTGTLEKDAGADPTDAGSPIEDAAPADADASGMDAAPIDTGPIGDPYPDPAAWGPNAGPGGPAATFAQDALYQTCTYLDGGPDDITDHHNLVTMFDGYLLMP